MSPEEVKRAGVEGSKRPPGHNPGGILHQRRSLPFSTTTIAITGFAIVGMWPGSLLTLQGLRILIPGGNTTSSSYFLLSSVNCNILVVTHVSLCDVLVLLDIQLCKLNRLYWECHLDRLSKVSIGGQGF